HLSQNQFYFLQTALLFLYFTHFFSILICYHSGGGRVFFKDNNYSKDCSSVFIQQQDWMI
ncbi:MAG: hypothetical protein ACK55Z_11960, partial [bacterium]